MSHYDASDKRLDKTGRMHKMGGWKIN